MQGNYTITHVGCVYTVVWIPEVSVFGVHMDKRSPSTFVFL